MNEIVLLLHHFIIIQYIIMIFLKYMGEIFKNNLFAACTICV